MPHAVGASSPGSSVPVQGDPILDALPCACALLCRKECALSSCLLLSDMLVLLVVSIPLHLLHLPGWMARKSVTLDSSAGNLYELGMPHHALAGGASMP